MIFSLLLISTAFAADLQPIQEVFEPQGSYDPQKFAKVAVVQWNRREPTPVGVAQDVADAFKLESRKQLEVFVREAASHGARLVVTPEFGLVGYPDIPELPSEEDDFRNPDDIRPYVETVPGPSTDYFGHLAAELGIYLQIGLAENDLTTGKFFNVTVAFNPKGEIAAKYRKINLYELETQFLARGEGISTYSTPFGRIGMIVCADVYSGDPMTRYLAAHVDALALSTSWAVMNSGMSSFQAGARWVHGYLLAANQTYFPDSGVINPDGTTQSHIRQSTGVAYGYLPYKNGQEIPGQPKP